MKTIEQTYTHLRYVDVIRTTLVETLRNKTAYALSAYFPCFLLKEFSIAS